MASIPRGVAAVIAGAFLAWMLIPAVSNQLLRTEIGYAGAVSVELMNPQIWRISPRQVGEVAITALRRVLGQANRFAIALRVHHPPVASHPLLEAPSFLMAEEHRRPAVPGADSADERRVVPGDAVSVHLDEVRRHPLEVVKGVRPIGMPGKLHDLPDGEGRLLGPAAVQLHG